MLGNPRLAPCDRVEFAAFCKSLERIGTRRRPQAQTGIGSIRIRCDQRFGAAGVRSPLQCDRPEGRLFISNDLSTARSTRSIPRSRRVVHSHSPAVIPFGMTSVKLRHVFHLSSFLAGGGPAHQNVT
jgi:hypothetical protein